MSIIIYIKKLILQQKQRVPRDLRGKQHDN